MPSLSGLASAAGVPAGAPPQNSYRKLKEQYEDFTNPVAYLLFNGQSLDSSLLIGEVEVDLTSGFEASIATIRIYNVFRPAEGKFDYKLIRRGVYLGASVSIQLGYASSMESVFQGFVAEVNFVYSQTGLPCVEVLAMDIKGLMMSGNYSQQLKSKCYSDAVQEIFQRTTYTNLQSAQGFQSFQVTPTPDKTTPRQASETIELAGESDYEFVVKAAKRFNYEFFTENGVVYFRKAKSDSTVLINLAPGDGVTHFRVGYSLTGLAGSVEARSIDAGTGKLISAKAKLNRKISMGSAAKGLVSQSSKVYVDPSITSQMDAEARAESLMEEMSYQLGALECETIGLPVLLPGHFMQLEGLGSPADNLFYITHVIHSFTQDDGYQTTLTASAAEIKT